MTNPPSNLLDAYREHLERAGKSPHTVKAYLHDLAAFAAWFHQTTGEAFAPQAVDPKDITEYRGFVLRNGGVPATVNRRLIALRRFFAWAQKQGHTAYSPFKVLESVRAKEQKDIAPRWLTHQEQLALLRAVRKGGARATWRSSRRFWGRACASRNWHSSRSGTWRSTSAPAG